MWIDYPPSLKLRRAGEDDDEDEDEDDDDRGMSIL